MEQGKNYKWSPDDKFEYSGSDFAMQYNILNKMVNTEAFQARINDAQEVTAILQLYKLVQTKLDEAITSGVAVVAEDTPVTTDATVVEQPSQN